MKTKLLAYLLPLVAFTAFGPPTRDARADDERRDAVRVFATLPDGVRFPEGIAANPVTRGGLAFNRGRLWVVANQNDEIVALNTRGRVIARLGEFEGINRFGAPDGLLFPASILIFGDDMFVTNLALPLTPGSGDEPEEQIRRWTVSRIKVPDR